MAYRIVSSDSHKIILERESAKLAARVFVVIGSIFFLIGVGINFLMTTWEMPFMLFRILFPLFGLIAIVAGIYLPKQTRETQPEQIVFDHDKGAVIVMMAKSGDQQGYIRYNEIDDFDIHVESRSSSSSRGASRTYYRYHVYLKKKDGGEWHFFDYGDRADAEAMMAQLKAQVPKDRPFNISDSPKLSSKIEKKEGLDKTIIHWQNKVTIWQPLFLFLFSTIFLSILSSFFTFGQEIDIFALMVMGFILTIFLFVLFTAVRRLIKDATTRYAVSVDHINLEYYEFAKSSGQMRNKRALSLQQVHSINYNFTPGQNNFTSGLKILTLDDTGRAQQYKEKPLEALKDLFKSNNMPISLSITALNPVECLQLENWLQELILKRAM